MKIIMTHNKKEQGFAALELVLLVPFFVLFSALVLNFCIYLSCTMKADSIASAGARYLMNHSTVDLSEDALTDVLTQSFPELKDNNQGYSISLTKGEKKKYSIEYPLYTQGSFQNISMEGSYNEYTVGVHVVHKWPALGCLFANEDGTFSINVHRQCEVDRMQDLT